MIISATLVKKPRKQRQCENCWALIEGAQIRFYGAARTAEQPYVVYVHPQQECTGFGVIAPKIQNVLAEVGK